MVTKTKDYINQSIKLGAVATLAEAALFCTFTEVSPLQSLAIAAPQAVLYGFMYEPITGLLNKMLGYESIFPVSGIYIASIASNYVAHDLQEQLAQKFHQQNQDMIRIKKEAMISSNIFTMNIAETVAARGPQCMLFSTARL